MVGVVAAIPIPWMDVRELFANTTELETKVIEDITPRFSVMWLVAPESIIQLCDRRCKTRYRSTFFELKWQRKRKTELMCSISAGSCGTTQIDIVTARHLEEWQRYMHLSLVSPSEWGIDTSYSLALYSSNNRPLSHLLVLIEDLFVRLWYHCGHQNVYQCSPFVSRLPLLSC